MIIAPLCSSSAANSTFVGSPSRGILVDVGCSYKALRGCLDKCGLDASAIKAVLVTHEHSDHVSGLKVFTKNNDIPVFASAKTREVLLQKGHVHNPDRLFCFDELGSAETDLEITPFRTPHDSAESVGFVITCTNGYKAVYMTDLGEINEEVRRNVLGADFAFIESNYDPKMLRDNVVYPHYTKERIRSGVGHLSNPDSAEFTVELVRNGCTRVVLAHLSRQNNTPTLAYSNTEKTLNAAGFKVNRDFTLNVAEIQTCGKYIAV
ncbi:MAG: MBL fold metallo-hydrolase [Oscillospiraceae bacterium]|nr:MBL fold metallo-hydrolase [Oscillospiraceae bacterium]